MKKSAEQLRVNTLLTLVKRLDCRSVEPKLLNTKVRGFVEIELRPDDNLYIDGKKVVLNLSERQMNNNRVVAHELRMELAGGKQGLLNCNVMDCL